MALEYVPQNVELGAGMQPVGSGAESLSLKLLPPLLVISLILASLSLGLEHSQKISGSPLVLIVGGLLFVVLMIFLGVVGFPLGFISGNFALFDWSFGHISMGTPEASAVLFLLLISWFLFRFFRRVIRRVYIPVVLRFGLIFGLMVLCVRMISLPRVNWFLIEWLPKFFTEIVL